MTGQCYYCDCDGVPACPHCTVISCPAHLEAHRPSNTCLPFRVEEREEEGRVCVAARDLEPGDLVLEDRAVLLVPGGGERLCLECGVNTEAECPQCGLAVCCEGPQHQVECRYTLSFPSNTSTHLGVAVVRVLNLQQDWRKDEVMRLMDHLEDRQTDQDWEIMETVVDCLLPALGETSSREEILRIAGIILTNTASCNSLTGGEDHCIGLFPVFSLLSHRCVANTRRDTDRGRMKVTATVPIKAGEQIVTSYKNPLLGSVARRSHFPRVWYFDCSCARCTDPSELGSHLSSLRCGDCAQSVLPSHPTHYNSPWSCSSCHLTLSAHQAMVRCVAMYRGLLSCPHSHQHLASLIANLQTVAHSNHYVILQAKMKFVMLASSEPAVVQLQVSLCEEILALLDIVEPGLTRRRAEIVRVLAVCKLKLMKLNPPTSGLEMMLQMKNLTRLLREVTRSKQLESEEVREDWAAAMKQIMITSSLSSS